MERTLPCQPVGVDTGGLTARTNRLLMAYQAGDMQTLREMVAPDVRIRPLSTEMELGPEYDGVAGLEHWVADLTAGDRDFQPAVTGIEEHGRRVLVVGYIYAASADGELHKTEAAWVFAFDDEDRLASLQAYLDHDAARAAAVA